MDIRPLTDAYSVTPQIAPEDIPALAAAGYTTVICNRPDAENPAPLQAEAVRAAAEAAGLVFVLNPVMPGQLTMENVETQRAAIDGAPGKVLAYCASGNRSSIVWALANAGRVPTDDLIAAGARYGYQLAQFRDMIDRLAQG
ncbi:MAG: TIGR01244 family phosphatase [Rhodobacter sp.]|uniref:TIGR01244 family sulfur transferase n=1 Tax=Pararhodobacter sp. TaxID=2127056 RepID=UPI001DF7D2ED|nr:TIGR01244 family sulfur transferase [Pararhodobacter sp.]MCB1345984.1 TIGR01244 family phosphatase [Paracoccaceae bacterium]MCC0074066.1 TIGR01244 family phosphatase [Rhodobacter sp.]HPD91832.1 TIGR01244 family sulfur transferase [Pararhodobacter sp.]